MTESEKVILSQGDNYRLRITMATDFLKRIPADGVRAAEYRKLLALYKDLLDVIEKHERIAQLAKVLTTECA